MRGEHTYHGECNQKSAGHGVKVVCGGVSPVDVHTLSRIEASTDDLKQALL